MSYPNYLGTPPTSPVSTLFGSPPRSYNLGTPPPKLFPSLSPEGVIPKDYEMVVRDMTPEQKTEAILSLAEKENELRMQISKLNSTIVQSQQAQLNPRPNIAEAIEKGQLAVSKKDIRLRNKEFQREEAEIEREKRQTQMLTTFDFARSNNPDFYLTLKNGYLGALRGIPLELIDLRKQLADNESGERKISSGKASGITKEIKRVTSVFEDINYVYNARRTFFDSPAPLILPPIPWKRPVYSPPVEIPEPRPLVRSTVPKQVIVHVPVPPPPPPEVYSPNPPTPQTFHEPIEEDNTSVVQEFIDAEEEVDIDEAVEDDTCFRKNIIATSFIIPNTTEACPDDHMKKDLEISYDKWNRAVNRINSGEVESKNVILAPNITPNGYQSNFPCFGSSERELQYNIRETRCAFGKLGVKCSIEAAGEINETLLKCFSVYQIALTCFFLQKQRYRYNSSKRGQNNLKERFAEKIQEVNENNLNIYEAKRTVKRSRPSVTKRAINLLKLLAISRTEGDADDDSIEKIRKITTGFIFGQNGGHYLGVNYAQIGPNKDENREPDPIIIDGEQVSLNMIEIEREIFCFEKR